MSKQSPGTVLRVPTFSTVLVFFTALFVLGFAASASGAVNVDFK